VEHSKHGERIETRRLQTTNRCNAQLDWPGLQQVCRLERTVQRKGQLTTTIAYAITSLCLLTPSPQLLLQLWRRHWLVENQLHYVRDVTLGEDACRVRTGAAPQLLAALRNSALALLPPQRVKNRAAATRNLAWQPAKAARLVGVPLLT
jgi:predicted transposase YbfD/YdcC